MLMDREKAATVMETIKSHYVRNTTFITACDMSIAALRESGKMHAARRGRLRWNNYELPKKPTMIDVEDQRFWDVLGNELKIDDDTAKRIREDLYKVIDLELKERRR